MILSRCDSQFCCAKYAEPVVESTSHVYSGFSIDVTVDVTEEDAVKVAELVAEVVTVVLAVFVADDVTVVENDVDTEDDTVEDTVEVTVELTVEVAVVVCDEIVQSMNVPSEYPVSTSLRIDTCSRHFASQPAPEQSAGASMNPSMVQPN